MRSLEVIYAVIVKTTFFFVITYGSIKIADHCCFFLLLLLWMHQYDLCKQIFYMNCSMIFFLIYMCIFLEFKRIFLIYICIFFLEFKRKNPLDARFLNAKFASLNQSVAR